MLGDLAAAAARTVDSLPIPEPVRQGFTDTVREVFTDAQQRPRRKWVAGGRAHIEVRGIHQPELEHVRRAVEQALLAVEGVHRAEANGALGRVAVAFDAAVAVEELVAVVEEAEQEHGAGDAPFSPAEHPGDDEPVAREVLFFGASVAGLGLSLAGRVLRATPLPDVAPVLLSVAENTPRVRTELERHLGQPATEAVFAVGGAITQTLVQQPLGLAIAIAHRFTLLTESQARQRGWEQREADLDRNPGAYRTTALDSPARPSPLPQGPIEQLASRATPATLATSAGAFLTPQGTARAQGFLAAGMPAAGRMGRDAFVAQLTQAAADRGVVTFDPDALRRLDRADTVVLDASALLTGRQVIEEVTLLADGGPASDGAADGLEKLHRYAHDLLDVQDLDARREHDGWVLLPLKDVERPPRRARELARARRRHGATVLALLHERDVVALVSVVAELDPLAEELVAAAARAGEVVLAGVGSRLQERLPVTRVVPGGPRLRSSVRGLQAAGAGVVLMAARSRAALAAADVGIGLVGRARRPPWGTHLLCGPGLAGACFLLDAIRTARQVSTRSSQLAAAGSTAGGLLTMAGPAATAIRRARTASHLANLLALADGTWAGRSLGRRPPPLGVDRTPWHELPADSVLERLGSSDHGLDEGEAARRRTGEGHEEQSPMQGVAAAAAEDLTSPLTLALGAGAGISAAVGSVMDAVLIVGVLGANAVISGVQRFGVDRELHELLTDRASTVRLRRGGDEVDVTAEDLVPGDVVGLASGDTVPADCRLLAVEGVEVDESSLTGEAQPVAKTPRPTSAEAVADRHSMLYQGTVVVAGSCVGVVVATGERTEVGRTTRLGAGEHRPSGVDERLRSLGRTTLPLSVGASTVLMIANLLRRYPFGEALGSAVSLAVAAVPEGLPFVKTVAELAAVRRLSGRGALVRNPATLEALGRVDALCFDKTGTLTKGRNQVGWVSDGVGGQPLDAVTPPLREVMAAAVRACPERDQHGRRPHPTDRAVLKAAKHLETAPSEGLGTWERVEELRFMPGRDYHAVLGRCAAGQRLSVKGAPETVLARCDTWGRGGQQVPFDAQARTAVDREVERLAHAGYRVLAVAERPASDRGDLDESRIRRLSFVGLLGLADPVRSTATAAVEKLGQAGVEIVMVTGDHPSTAESIAAELDVLNGRRIVTGPELDAMGDEQLDAELRGIAVFARATPAHKARIVEGLQRAGKAVAVTGDGANDVPAIRLADVGLAVGKRATPAAREAADVIITNNRIEKITDAVVEGRAMWSSIRDALAILVGGNLGETTFTVGTGLMPGRGGLNARQLLLVNLLTDLLPAMAVASQPPAGVSRERLLREGPEASLGGALNRDIAVRAVTTASAATLAWVAGRLTGTPAQGRTTALVALVGAQLGQTIAAGSRSFLVVGAGAVSLAALAATVQIPGVSHFFGSSPLAPHGWAIALGAACAATLAGLLLPAVLERAFPAGDQATPDAARGDT